jgi:hypothetical protein
LREVVRICEQAPARRVSRFDFSSVRTGLLTVKLKTRGNGRAASSSAIYFTDRHLGKDAGEKE